MGSLTGGAKKAARAQAAALEEQTRQARAQAAEAARQAAVQTTQMQQRDVAVRDVEAMQSADALANKDPEVDLGAQEANQSTTRKRARFQPNTAIQSVSI